MADGTLLNRATITDISFVFSVYFEINPGRGNAIFLKAVFLGGGGQGFCFGAWYGIPVHSQSVRSSSWGRARDAVVCMI